MILGSMHIRVLLFARVFEICRISSRAESIPMPILRHKFLVVFFSIILCHFASLLFPVLLSIIYNGGAILSRLWPLFSGVSPPQQ